MIRIGLLNPNPYYKSGFVSRARKSGSQEEKRGGKNLKTKTYPVPVSKRPLFRKSDYLVGRIFCAYLGKTRNIFFFL
jgi:hypothetical protein